MSCNDTRRLLDAWVDNELDLRAALEMEEHLDRCADCAAQERNLRELQAFSRENLTRHQMPPGLDARLRASLRTEAGAASDPRRRRPRRALRWAAPLLAASVAAVVAV